MSAKNTIVFGSSFGLEAFCPKLEQFLDPAEVRRVENAISSRETLDFMPNDTMENHISVGKEFKYVNYLFGTLRDGTKATVVLEDPHVYFDVRVPKGRNSREFRDALQTSLQRENRKDDMAPREARIIQGFPFKGLHEKPVDYIRLSFNTNYKRKKAQTYLDPDPRRDGRIQHSFGKLELASDDMSCYYRKVAREEKFNMGGWNALRDYRVDRSGKLSNTKHVFRMPISGIKAKNSNLRDKTVVCTWDIETYVPEEHRDGKVHTDRVGKDRMFMVCMTFHWHYDSKPFHKVCVTSLPCPSSHDTTTIYCKNEQEIIMAVCTVMKNMQPSFITGFNDGGYDWPLFLHRANHYKLMSVVKSHMGCVPLNENTDKWIYGKQPREENVKVSAEVSVKRSMLNVPGIIAYDTQAEFQKLYPAAEYKSLNFFLACNKLDSKEDMPYKRMNDIVEAVDHMQERYSVRTWPSLCAKVLDDPDLCETDTNDKAVRLRSRPYLLKVLNDCEKVRSYCVADAHKCQLLCLKRSVIGDKRAMASMSYTSMYDGFVRANGMKVRNLVMSTGCEPEWNILFSTKGASSKIAQNYPGAWVFKPKKGIQRDTVQVQIKQQLSEEAQAQAPGTDLRLYEEILAMSEQEIYARFVAGDPTVCGAAESKTHNRPVVGLDFSSLYPSECMANNYSPEKIITDPKQAAMFDPKELNEIEFIYQHWIDSKAKIAEDRTAKGWSVKHHNDPKQMGLYPTILKKLFDDRSAFKKIMFKFGQIKEFMEKYHGLEVTDLATNARAAKAVAEKEVEDMKAAGARKRLIDKKSRDVWRYNQISEYLETQTDKSFDEVFDEVDFQHSDKNSKQLAKKVFMNTFYGEAGNQISAFFMLLVAGGITSAGQRNIKQVDKFVRERDCFVHYGDTDSVYVSAPDAIFKDIDQQYLEGKITKKKYWEEMIYLTMDYMDEIKNEVNAMLKKDSGGPFLKVAYEEVLYPVLFCGKKKYTGIPHEDEVNLSACMPGTTWQEFKKALFMRGLEIKKRGASEFVKQVSYELLQELFCIETEQSVMRTVLSKFENIMRRKWDPKMFIKRARWKKPDQGKPGNVTVLGFIDRMEKSGKLHTELGDRFDYIIVKPPSGGDYDLRGRRKTYKVSDMMEYPEALDQGYEINMDYYMTGEVIGMFSRFIVYHPDFEVADVDDEEADEKAIKLAKKFLTRLYNSKYATNIVCSTTAYKNIFNKVNSKLKQKVKTQTSNHLVLDKTNVVITGSELEGLAWRMELEKEILKKAKTDGKKWANKQPPPEFKGNPHIIAKMYRIDNPDSPIFKQLLVFKDQEEIPLKEELGILLTGYQQTCDKIRQWVAVEVEHINLENETELTEEDPNLNFDTLDHANVIGLTPKEMETLEKIDLLYIKIVSRYRYQQMLLNAAKAAQEYKEISGGTYAPPRHEKRDMMKDFSAFLTGRVRRW